MGEIADMMLDGTLCEGCGEYLGDDGGYPVRCASCARDLEQATATYEKASKGSTPKFSDAPKIACPCCSKMVKITGIGEHWKAVHSKRVQS